MFEIPPLIFSVLLEAVLTLTIGGLVLYMVNRWRGSEDGSGKERKVKTMIVLGSGGHTAEMIKLVSPLKKERSVKGGWGLDGQTLIQQHQCSTNVN